MATLKIEWRKISMETLWSLWEVVSWVKNLWSKITDSRVANALRAGYKDKKKHSRKESSVAKHEGLGSRVQDTIFHGMWPYFVMWYMAIFCHKICGHILPEIGDPGR